jgi:hypothetical protein
MTGGGAKAGAFSPYVVTAEGRSAVNLHEEFTDHDGYGCPENANSLTALTQNDHHCVRSDAMRTAIDGQWGAVQRRRNLRSRSAGEEAR